MKRLGKAFSAVFLGFALISAAGCASTEKQESTGEYLDDSVITGKVKAAILGEPGLKVMEIKVETYKGVVQLSGFVESQEDVDRAVEVARDVKGVKSVENNMSVK